MQLVTAAELAEYFDRLTGSIDALGGRLSFLEGTGRLQEYFTREEAAEYLRISVAKLDGFPRYPAVSWL